jgi:hypothetical protein
MTAVLSDLIAQGKGDTAIATALGVATGRLTKHAWVKLARRDFQQSRRATCQVCGRFFDLTQAHHLIPLTAQYDRRFEVADHDHVWLCPNHHAILHRMIEVARGREKKEDTLGMICFAGGWIIYCSNEELAILSGLLVMSWWGL